MLAELKPVTSVEGITEYQLDNGLQVLLFPDPSVATITVNVTYRVGSRHEGRGEAGMAHLLEHMVFKGTPSFPNIWGALEDHGATFNGTTWVDRTNYFETLPASKENLDFALRMEADRMVNSLIKAEELAKEMTVVRNEFEMGENSPTSVLSERMMSAAYLWHNYGKSTIGNRSDIERVPVENLRTFYKRYYQPDNATLLVAGKFDTEEVLQKIQQYFGSIPRPDRALDRSYTEEPPQDGARLVTLKRVGDVAAAGVVYHIPAGHHPDFAAIEILEDILTNQPTGKLYRGLVVQGLATSVSGSAFAFAEPGVITFMAQVDKNQQPESVLNYMIEILEQRLADSISESDVESAKARSQKATVLGMRNSSRFGVRLSESIAQGDWRLFFVHRDRVQAVTLADVQRVARQYLVESNRTAGLFIPTKESARVAISTAPDVNSLVENYTGRQEVSAGEPLVPDVQLLEQRIQRIVLPSGIKLAMLPVKSRGEGVQASIRFHYGTEASLRDFRTAEQLVAPMLMRGTKQKNHEQLQDAIDQLQSQIMVGAGGGGPGRRGGGGGMGGAAGIESAMIISDRGHFIPALELLAEILQQPAFDSAEFDIVKKMRLSMLEQSLSDPNMRGMNELRRAVNPWPADSIHYVPTLEERMAQLEATTLEQVHEMYDRHFGASHMEIGIVGDFDALKVQDALEKLFGRWKSQSEYRRIEKPFRPAVVEDMLIRTPDKEMALVAMGTAVPMRDDDPRYPAMVLANYVLGQSAKSRLMTRLRHEGGLSYGAGAGLTASPQDTHATFSGMAICAPANAEKALEIMRSEVQDWVANGISEEEIQEAKQSYALNQKRSLASEMFLVSEMTSGLEIGRTLQFQQDLMDKIEKLTLDDIRQALRDVFGEAGYATVKAGDLPEEHRQAARSTVVPVIISD